MQKNNSIDQRLAAFEKDRKTQLRKISLMQRIGYFLLGIAVLMIFVEWAISIPLVISWVVLKIIENNRRLQFSRRFQSELVPMILEKLNPDFSVKLNQTITPVHLLSLGMQDVPITRLIGSYLIERHHAQPNFLFAELAIDARQRNVNGKSTIDRVFSGNVMLVKVPTTQPFYIFPNQTITMNPFFSSVLSQLLKEGFEKIRTNHQAFDQNFVLYTKPDNTSLNPNLLDETVAIYH